MTTFCLDTSAFINPWHKLYPIDVFPSYWRKIEEWGKQGQIIAPDEVRIEVAKIDDDLHKWVQQRGYLFMAPDADVQKAVLKVLAASPRLVDAKKGRSFADPWVIAQASVTGSVVVTEEKQSGGKSPRIPDVCGARGIPCITVLSLIRAMQLKF